MENDENDEPEKYPARAAHREPSHGWEDGGCDRRKDTGEFCLNDRPAYPVQ